MLLINTVAPVMTQFVNIVNLHMSMVRLSLSIFYIFVKCCCFTKEDRVDLQFQH